MPSCSTIDSLVTPYVDGELDGPDRDRIEAHLRACPPCASRVTAERAVRALLHDRQPTLQSTCASALLRTKCRAYVGHDRTVAADTAAPLRRRAGSRYVLFAIAATLLMLVGGGVMYGITGRSSKVMAAELAADHMKCLTMNAVLRTRQSASAVEHAMASGFGWTMRVPPALGAEGLELVGSRPCLYGQGKVAHVMYRHNGRLLSLFMLPASTRHDEVVEVFGHQCVIWSAQDRTFVLVSGEDRAAAERLAAFIQKSLD